MYYNLVDEKWIPVLCRDGKLKRVGIHKAFEEASRISQIATTNPMDRVAILRFLLALLYWCKGNPPDEIPDDSFPSAWFKKLDENMDCFNLLGDRKRFYQDRTARRTRAVTDLIQEIPAGNNFWHFRHSTDQKDGLCPACCAMGLLRLPLFSVSGLSGPGEPSLMAGINGVPPVYVVPWGKSLFETLLANWVTCKNIGKPAWDQSAAGYTQDGDVPLLTGFTLLPRRVLLHDPIKEPATCISCGTKTAVIQTCEFQTAGKQENDKWNDPHVIYLESKSRRTLRAQDSTEAGKRGADGSLYVKFRMDRPWHDLLARIVETRKPALLFIVGFATNKAKNVDVWERIIDMRSTASVSKTAADSIRHWQNEGREMEKKIARSNCEGPAAIAAIRPHVEGRVSARAGELIAGNDDMWEQAAREYSSMMVAIAKSLFPGYTSLMVQRRRWIARLIPNVRSKKGAAKKCAPEMGGDK